MALLERFYPDIYVNSVFEMPLEDMKKLFERFDSECASTYIDKDNVKLPISIAKGFAKFDPDKDTRFSDVFNRADSEMYKNKRLTKEINT